MTKRPKAQLVYTLTGFSLAAGIFSVVIGCLVLSGWAFDIDSLKSVVPGLATMKANTAACFLLSGLSLVLWRQADVVISSNSGTARRAANVLSVAVIIIAAITLSEYLFNWNAGIDELIFRVPKTDAALPGRMSSATAFEFLLIGGTLLLLSGKQRYTAAAQFFAAAAMVFSLLALLAYLFNLGHIAELVLSKISTDAYHAASR